MKYGRDEDPNADGTTGGSKIRNKRLKYGENKQLKENKHHLKKIRNETAPNLMLTLLIYLTGAVYINRHYYKCNRVDQKAILRCRQTP